MLFRKPSLLILLIALAQAPAAWAVQVTAAGGTTYSSLASSDGGLSGNGKIGYGGELFADFGSGSWYRWELGVQYLGNNNTGVNSTEVSIPVMFRMLLGKYFSFGLGGYYGVILNSPAILQNYDFGATGSLNFIFPFSNSVALVLDARYNFGIYNVGVINTTTLRAPMAFLGLRFGGGSSSGGGDY